MGNLKDKRGKRLWKGKIILKQITKNRPWEIEADSKWKRLCIVNMSGNTNLFL